MFFSMTCTEYEGFLALLALGHTAGRMQHLSAADQFTARRVLREQAEVAEKIWAPLGAKGSDRLLTRLHKAAEEVWGNALRVGVAPVAENEIGAFDANDHEPSPT